AARFLDLGKPAVERLEIEGPLPRTLRHAEPAAEIEITDVREALEQLDELLAGIPPRLGREHAAARMGVQAHDARACGAGAPRELLDLEQRHAELGVSARRAHVLVMPAALSRVDANEDVRAPENLGPHLERVQIVEREPDA